MASQIPPGFDLCQLPGGYAPEGETYNLVNPENLQNPTIGVSVVLTAWALIFLLGRLIINFRKLQLADYFVLIAFVLSVTYTGLILAMVKYTRHQWNVPACWFTGDWMKILYAQGVLLGPVIFFAKASIFLLYKQLFRIQRPMRLAIYAGLVATFLIYFPGIPLESYFSAPHVGESWEDLLTNGMPARLEYWALVQGSLSVVLDIYIFVLPIPVLAGLNMSFQRRLGLLAVFLTAVMGIVASVIALVFRVKLLNSADSTWQQSALFICVITENNVAIIVACMPAFSTFMKVHVGESAFFKSLRSTLVGSGSGSSRTAGTYGSSKISKGQSAKAMTGASSGDLTAHDGAYFELNDSVHLKSKVVVSRSFDVSSARNAGNGAHSSDGREERHPDFMV